jgi:hypothetical protein
MLDGAALKLIVGAGLTATHAPAGGAVGSHAVAVQQVGYGALTYDRVCVHDPVVPAGQAAVRVSVAGCGAVHVGGGAATCTVTLRAVEPPLPVQVSVNVLVACRLKTPALPYVALDPDHPPLATQLCARDALQLSVVAPL